MRLIVGTTGLCLIGIAVATFVAGLKAGLCLGLGIMGIGLFVDAVRK